MWWIGILVLLLLIAIWWRPVEGFQVKTPNVPYTKEVFVVGFPGSKAAPTYANGFTYDEAVTKCRSYGAELATSAQLQTAQVLGAEWSVIGGWVNGNKTTLYYPAKMGVQSLAATGKGFATCYGQKPAQGEPGVQFFSSLDYSVLDTGLVAKTMSGDGMTLDEKPEFFPHQVNAGEALFALERAAPGQTATSNPRVARNYIVTNWATLAEAIRAQDPTPEESPSAWTQGKAKSCQGLDGIQQGLIEQHNKLKGLYGYLQTLTWASISAKQENVNFQREVAGICRGMTSATSPACKQLAEADGTIFYGTDQSETGFFKALDNLNSMLAARECEMQLGIAGVQRVMTTLKCDAEQRPFQTAVLGNFRSENGDYYNCLSKDADTADYQGQFPDRYQVRTKIGFIPSQDLRTALEEISPFFNEPGYKDLFEQILKSLSVLLRIPELNDYSTATQKLNTVPVRMDTIRSSLNNLWPNTPL